MPGETTWSNSRASGSWGCTWPKRWRVQYSLHDILAMSKVVPSERLLPPMTLRHYGRCWKVGADQTGCWDSVLLETASKSSTRRMRL